MNNIELTVTDVANKLTLDDFLCGQCNLLEQCDKQVARCTLACRQCGHEVFLSVLDDNKFFKTADCMEKHTHNRLIEQIKRVYDMAKGETK